MSTDTAHRAEHGCPCAVMLGASVLVERNRAVAAEGVEATRAGAVELSLANSLLSTKSLVDSGETDTIGNQPPSRDIPH